MNKIDILRNKPVFIGLNEDELNQLANLTEEETFPPNFNIITENEFSNSIYVIISGSAQVIKTDELHNDKKQTLATLLDGDCFGEMSLIDIEPRSATVSTISETKILKLTTESIRKFSEFSKDGFTLMILNIARILSQRLRKTNSDLTNLGSGRKSITTG